MSDQFGLRHVLVFFLSQTDDEINVTKLVKLAYLSEVEHQLQFNETLTDEEWVYHNYGPFAFSIYPTLDALAQLELIGFRQQMMFQSMGRFYQMRADASQMLAQIPGRAMQVLEGVQARFGAFSVQQIKDAAYQTATMKAAKPNDRLDFRLESMAAAKRIPGIAAFVRDAPPVRVIRRGNREESLAEDEAILAEFSGLRREANRELG